MTLREIIDRLLGRQQASATTAKHRLQLVLAHDHSDLNPDLMEQMRREILEVVNRYVELDLEGGDVSLETEERATAWWQPAHSPRSGRRSAPGTSSTVKPQPA